MKKRIIKAGILLAVFLLGVAGFSCLMNQKGTDNKTDMETAVMPVMAMLLGDTEVNRMYGYAQEMETDYLRDTLTPVGTDKTLGVSITPNGQEIDSLVYEIRTFDGDKVVENDQNLSGTGGRKADRRVYPEKIHIDESGVCPCINAEYRGRQLELLYQAHSAGWIEYTEISGLCQQLLYQDLQ